MNPRRSAILPTSLVVLGLIASGCGSSGSNSSAIQAAPAANAPAASSDTTSTQAQGTSTTPANPALAKKPVIARPSGPAPSKLVIKDLVKGSGAAAKAGQQLSVQYVGVLFKNGKQFDASWDRGMPFAFTLGQGMVIPGWDQGLVGMQVGGRRELIIPPALAYGAQGSPPTIGPNEPLIFVIDLLSAQ